MRQVPYFLLIGDGRVARHFQCYFNHLQLNYTTWNRKQSVNSLKNSIAKATHILILISDQAIESFCQEYLKQSQAIHLHCSGSLVTEYAYGLHPLMTFSDHLYTLAEYQSIPFIVDHDAPSDLMPGVLNQQIRLHKSLKSKYHALCVLSGNFSCMLWQKMFETFEREFHMPKSIAHAYLIQQTKNLLDDDKNALTGPLVRNDRVTIEKNLIALSSDPFQEVYKSFVACYQKINEEIV